MFRFWQFPLLNSSELSNCFLYESNEEKELKKTTFNRQYVGHCFWVKLRENSQIIVWCIGSRNSIEQLKHDFILNNNCKVHFDCLFRLNGLIKLNWKKNRIFMCTGLSEVASVIRNCNVYFVEWIENSKIGCKNNYKQICVSLSIVSVWAIHWIFCRFFRSIFG